MDIAAIRAGQLPALTAMFALARIRPLLAAPFLVLDRLMFRVSPARAVRALAGMLTLPDRELLGNDAQVRRAFGASLAEAYAQGVAGALREAHLIGSARGFALEDIAGPVHVYQGGVDRHVPPAMGRYLAATIPEGRLHFHPQEGHLSILVNRFGDCLRDFRATAAAPIALSPSGAVADIGIAQSQSTAH
jgi:pimeloyl-ACP methyl ester carboxylesterase